MKIGPHNVKIVKREMDDLHGELRHKRLEIHINNTPARTQQEETLFHYLLSLNAYSL